jgi:aldose 1-epimerase
LLTPVNEDLVPTGEIAPVERTPFDFRTPQRIGERIDQKNEQLKLGIGYDHNYVINGEPGPLRFAARVVDPGSGRMLDVLTTQPGVQFYTGNHLHGNVVGKGGAVYGFRAGFCLETQHFPDSPHHPGFPTTVLNPGEEFRSTTIFRFSAAG